MYNEHRKSYQSSITSTLICYKITISCFVPYLCSIPSQKQKEGEKSREEGRKKRKLKGGGNKAGEKKKKKGGGEDERIRM